MSKNRKSFCVVCIANYCRSPVVENLLKKRFKNRYEFLSAGIAPISLPSMDPRSLEFLKKNDISYSFHNAKKVNIKMLNYFDFFLAVDIFVLNQLNTNFSMYRNKFKLITSQFNDITIYDPYKLDNDSYEEIMKNILYVTENIKLEEV